MTRQEYMQQLAALLAAMPEAERRDALGYYEEYFDAAGPEKEALTLGEKADGYSVQAACSLGSITVSGAKQASPYSANSKAANTVILDAALGDITLNFEE